MLNVNNIHLSPSRRHNMFNSLKAFSNWNKIHLWAQSDSSKIKVFLTWHKFYYFLSRNMDEFSLELVWWFMGWGFQACAIFLIHYMCLLFSKVISLSKMTIRAPAIPVNRKDKGIQRISIPLLLKNSSKGCTQISAREARKGSIFSSKPVPH